MKSSVLASCSIHISSTCTVSLKTYYRRLDLWRLYGFMRQRAETRGRVAVGQRSLDGHDVDGAAVDDPRRSPRPLRDAHSCEKAVVKVAQISSLVCDRPVAFHRLRAPQCCRPIRPLSVGRTRSATANSRSKLESGLSWSGGAQFELSPPPPPAAIWLHVGVGPSKVASAHR